MLHAIEDGIGYVPDEAVPMIAERLNLSRAEVHGVVTFYHHYRRHAPGRHVVQVCRARGLPSRWAPASLEAHATGRRSAAGYHRAHRRRQP
jgi:formate dehydrogenase subunit gamma